MKRKRQPLLTSGIVIQILIAPSRSVVPYTVTVGRISVAPPHFQDLKFQYLRDTVVIPTRIANQAIVVQKMVGVGQGQEGVKKQLQHA
jgi:hypothetical protein